MPLSDTDMILNPLEYRKLWELEIVLHKTEYGYIVDYHKWLIIGNYVKDRGTYGFTGKIKKRSNS